MDRGAWKAIVHGVAGVGYNLATKPPPPPPCSQPTSFFTHSSIQSTKTKPGADCGSDHELLITKFRLKLKKVGKTARPFRYDLNQIPYDLRA